MIADMNMKSEDTIGDIIREIEQKSEGGGYIYRGERKRYEGFPYYGRVSSNLWREYCIDKEHFDIEIIQKELLAAAKKHTGHLPQDSRLGVMTSPSLEGELTEEAIDFEILTQIQHYGGKTNLIDFTKDYRIALFFACDGEPDEDGRIIIQKTDKIEGMIAHPQNPRHRVIAQKSVFVRPPRGFIKPHEGEIVIVPAPLKQPLLQHLQDYNGISTEGIYNDLYGFIRNQDIHGDAYTAFHKGIASQNRAAKAINSEEKHQEYEESIKNYTKAIKLKPDFTEAYYNRGVVYKDKGDFDDAIKDYTTVIQLKPNHATAYYKRGLCYVDKGDFDDAIKDYTTAIKLKPNRVEVYNRRAETYSRKGDFDDAIKDYTTAIKLKPSSAMYYYKRGLCYVYKRDFDDAIKDYTTAIKLQPNLVRAYYNRGEARLNLQEWEEAKLDLMTAKNMGVNIIWKFHNDYASVEDFEQKTGIQFPSDIATLLIP